MLSLVDKFRVVAIVMYVAAIIIALIFGSGQPIGCALWGVGLGFYTASFFLPRVDSTKKN